MITPPALVTCAALQLGAILAVAQTTNRAPNLVDPATPPATAESDSRDTSPDATLQLHGGSIAAGIGYVWGHGKVSYEGSDHSFNIRGVSVVDVGGASISATGVVMHLHKLADFSGRYVAWGAGVTLASGGSAVYMKNEHGVVIKLLSSTVGLRFNLSGNGVKVTLKS
jgi:hypothetical protein